MEFYLVDTMDRVIELALAEQAVATAALSTVAGPHPPATPHF
jgi:hypothetical protein